MKNKINKLIKLVSAQTGVEIPIPKVYYRAGMTKTAGYCSFRRNAIVLSSYFAALNKEVMKECLIHELSHFCSYYVYGCADHGIRWQLMCINFGISPKLTYTF